MAAGCGLLSDDLHGCGNQQPRRRVLPAPPQTRSPGLTSLGSCRLPELMSSLEGSGLLV